jgi:glycosyltransferase involved in cell wall biosynthesis
MDISIIICCYNSQLRIKSTLEHLACQNLGDLCCELILVDNNCQDNTVKTALSVWKECGNPFALRVEEEKRSGLSHARKKGIFSTKGEIIVFCDDDNWLESDYLLTAYSISINYPFLGVWGGSIVPVFELKPPNWKLNYISYLAIREVSEIKWSNSYLSSDCEPWGAGLCIRRICAQNFISKTFNDKILLGRCKDSLLSGEDTEMVFSLLDNDMGMGLFPNLKLKHYLPKKRFEDDYLINIISGMTYSNIVLKHKLGLDYSLNFTSNYKNAVKIILKLIIYPFFKKKLLLKNIIAERNAVKDISKK